MDDFDTEHENSFIHRVINIFEDYGWYILIGGALLAYIAHLFRPNIQKYLNWRSEQEYAAKYHKNPDLLIKRLEAQSLRTQQLQSQYEKDAAIYKQKELEREAKKQEEILKKYDKVNVGEKLGSTSQNASTSKSLKPEYNPLMGDSSRSYRPTRKSPCSGGGCGRR